MGRRSERRSKKSERIELLIEPCSLFEVNEDRQGMGAALVSPSASYAVTTAASLFYSILLTISLKKKFKSPKRKLSQVIPPYQDWERGMEEERGEQSVCITYQYYFPFFSFPGDETGGRRKYIMAGKPIPKTLHVRFVMSFVCRRPFPLLLAVSITSP